MLKPLVGIIDATFRSFCCDYLVIIPYVLTESQLNSFAVLFQKKQGIFVPAVLVLLFIRYEHT
jgi:hypothetical protein